MKKALVVLAIIVAATFSWFAYLSLDADKRDQDAAQVPLITVMEILHASDLQEGVKQAVKEAIQKERETPLFFSIVTT